MGGPAARSRSPRRERVRSTAVGAWSFRWLRIAADGAGEHRSRDRGSPKESSGGKGFCRLETELHCDPIDGGGCETESGGLHERADGSHGLESRDAVTEPRVEL